MTISDTVFSEYEAREMKVIFDDGEVGTIKCIGSVEEEMEVTTISKKCRGVTVKKRTHGTGSGTLTMSAHVAYELYNKMLGMDADDLADGVVGYGRYTAHPQFTVTAYVLDEDGVEKYKAYPACVVNSGPARSIENGAEEVAEIELEIGVMPDENGYGLYEALADDISSDMADSWMESFTTDLVTATTA